MRETSERHARTPRQLLFAILVGLFAAMCSVSAFADHLVVLSDSPLPTLQGASPVPPEITYAGASSSGGLVLAGDQGFYNGWTAHVSGDANYVWVSTFPQRWSAVGARAVSDARDGGFWVVGYGTSVDTTGVEHQFPNPMDRLKVVDAASYDYLARLDKSGNVFWQRRIFEGHQRFTYCVREASDGPIVLGYRSVTYRVSGDNTKPAIVDVPWLTKFDSQGRIRWDIPLVPDDMPAFETDDLRGSSCTGLHVSSNDQITVAFTALEFEGITKTSAGVVLPANYRDQAGARGTVVVQIDRDGHIVHSIKTTNASNAYLFAAGSGFSLVEHLRYKADDHKLPARDLFHVWAADIANIKRSGIRITRLDDRLETVSTQEISLPAFAGRVSAVLPARSGGYFVTGCDESGYNSIARVTTAGSISALQRIKPSPSINQCDTFGLANGQNDGEVIMFYGGRLDGNNVARLKTTPD